MTTIASLPEELIRHILALAFLDYSPAHDPDAALQRESKQGLARASLVHSFWRPAAQALLTSSLQFDAWKPKLLHRFRDRGPRGVRCRRLSVDGFARNRLLDLLTQFDDGGVAELRIAGKIPVDVFRVIALRDLERLTIDGGGYVLHETYQWPSKLRRLVLRPQLAPVPLALFTASAVTLRSLDANLTTPAQLATLAAAAPSLTSLATLNLGRIKLGPSVLGDTQSGILPSTLSATLALLPARVPLALRLYLADLAPADLAHLMHGLPRHSHLVHLRTTLAAPLARPSSLLGTAETHASADADADADAERAWAGALRHCAQAPALARRAAWKVLLPAAYGAQALEEGDLARLFGAGLDEYVAFEKVLVGKLIQFHLVADYGGDEDDTNGPDGGED